MRSKLATVICSSKLHPAWAAVQKWGRAIIVDHPDDAPGGDFLFLVSCTEIVSAEVRGKYRHSLVLHASDLPAGKGWSPHVWQVVQGENRIVVSLVEAADRVDSGDIWRKETVQLHGHELYDEINALVIGAEIRLMNFALDQAGTITPVPQSGEQSYYPRRTPADSEIDPNRSIAAQFNLLRVADPERYPAFFVLNGVRYNISIRKAIESND